MFTSSVISGFGRGKGLGFPTLNLKIPQGFDKKYGIYAGWVWIGKEKFQGAFHYGPIPTFDHEQDSLEVFLLDTDLETTPKEISFELVKYLREVMKFDTSKALVNQIDQDVKDCRKVLAKN